MKSFKEFLEEAATSLKLSNKPEIGDVVAFLSKDGDTDHGVIGDIQQGRAQVVYLSSVGDVYKASGPKPILSIPIVKLLEPEMRYVKAHAAKKKRNLDNIQQWVSSSNNQKALSKEWNKSVDRIASRNYK